MQNSSFQQFTSCSKCGNREYTHILQNGLCDKCRLDQGPQVSVIVSIQSGVLEGVRIFTPDNESGAKVAFGELAGMDYDAYQDINDNWKQDNDVQWRVVPIEGGAS